MLLSLFFSKKMRYNTSMKRVIRKIECIVWIVLLFLTTSVPIYAEMDQIPAYSNSPYTIIDDNHPSFSSSELDPTSKKVFQPLDSLGRTQSAFAVIGLDLMPTKKRSSIGMVKPSGWHLVKYDCVQGKYLYNRCHLIGYQLCGENANEKNLITGTRYLNVQGMLPFENQIADFVEATEYHVADRVTPIYEGDNLLASGVHMEAQSIEDDGSGLSINVYCYNVQPGVNINYTNGESSLEQVQSVVEQSVAADYVLNTNTKKFHKPSCSSANIIAEHNKELYNGSREDLIEQGYSPCLRCNP